MTERPTPDIGLARRVADDVIREHTKGKALLLARAFRWADSERARLESERREAVRHGSPGK